ncbi:conserved hypothetical protein [Aspergillus terreus NIH2624]|uniref:Tachykinin family protein n=1 Tax=Aspergillus terreus (strain NIH 2624 / FGSC A1156) TaxID=341663 RepID=Q0CU81_ASPTN|nr:uncharacterized protein ATEG_02753 [Aspergillus terreus NIH2624]EAU37715.1 conserved hypothetical protein [Aspergillus terreus NIH2624]
MAPTNQPTFTFIDHDDDLSSKRINDANARRAIRSHVMRDVRRRERIAGLRRVSRRGSRARKKETPFMQSSGLNSSEHILPRRRASAKTEPVGNMIVLHQQPQCRASSNMASSASSSSPEPLIDSGLAPSLLDPFVSLPGAEMCTDMVNKLVFYWKTVFIPITFPKEHKLTEQFKRGLLVHTSFTDAGSFFGLMTMCAAHRAIMAGRHSDLQRASESTSHPLYDQDYYIMKGKCIAEMSAKIHDSTKVLSNEALGTILNLLSGSLIVGLFDETRIHLRCLEHMVELRGGLVDCREEMTPLKAAVLMTDVKAATGLMTDTVFPLVWSPNPVPADVKRRISPPDGSSLKNLGIAFHKIPILSRPLLRILDVMTDIIFYSHMCKESPSALSDDDHDFFRNLNREVEHLLLSYVHTQEDGQNTPFPGSNPDPLPLETVTRVAAICYLNYFLIKLLPSAGLSRALTKHLKSALSHSSLQSSPKEYHALVAWALFIGGQGSIAQVERPWFVERLAHISRSCKWHNWGQVTRVMGEYFYLPSTNESIWATVWDEAMAVLAQEDST